MACAASDSATAAAPRTASALATRVCELASTGKLAEIGRLGEPSDLGFEQQWRDPDHHTPGPAPVRVLATGKRGSFEQAQLARYTETMTAIARDLAGAPAACASLPALRSTTFHGTGWASAPDVVVFVANDRSWGVNFWFGPPHGAPHAPLALRTIERWDAGHCPAGLSERPATCLGIADATDTCRCQ